MDLSARIFSLLFLLYHLFPYIHAQYSHIGGIVGDKSCAPHHEKIEEALFSLYFTAKAAYRTTKADPSSWAGHLFESYFLPEDRDFVRNAMVAILRAINNSGPQITLACDFERFCTEAAAVYTQGPGGWQDSIIFLCLANKMGTFASSIQPVTDYCMRGGFSVSLADTLMHELIHWEYITNFTTVKDLVYNSEQVHQLRAGQLFDDKTQAVLLPRHNAQNYMMLGIEAKLNEVMANSSWCAPGGPGGIAAAKADTSIPEQEDASPLPVSSSTSSSPSPSPASSAGIQVIDHGELRRLKGVINAGGSCTLVPDPVAGEASTPPTPTNELPTSTPTGDWQSTWHFDPSTLNATTWLGCSGLNSTGANEMGQLSPVGYVHVPANSSDFLTDVYVNTSQFRDVKRLGG